MVGQSQTTQTAHGVKSAEMATQTSNADQIILNELHPTLKASEEQKAAVTQFESRENLSDDSQEEQCI